MGPGFESLKVHQADLAGVPDAVHQLERAEEGTRTWPVGQAVKTPASHAGNAGSIPARVTKRVDLGREAGFRYMAKRLNAAKH